MIYWTLVSPQQVLLSQFKVVSQRIRNASNLVRQTHRSVSHCNRFAIVGSGPPAIGFESRLEFLADLAVERVGAAAAQRDGKEDDTKQDEQFHLSKAQRHLHLESDDGHFNGGCSRKKPRAEAENDAKGANRFDDDDDISQRRRRLDAVFYEAWPNRVLPRRDLAPAMEQKRSAEDDADHRVPEIGDCCVK